MIASEARYPEAKGAMAADKGVLLVRGCEGKGYLKDVSVEG